MGERVARANADHNGLREQQVLSSMPTLKYLTHYPEPLQAKVRTLIAENRLGEVLQKRYPEANTVRTDKALQAYTLALKAKHMKSAATPTKVIFDNHLQVVKHAAVGTLGTHTQVSRVHGGGLVAKWEIRIASVFIDAPAAFLKMIVVHELAHLKQREHDKSRTLQTPPTVSSHGTRLRAA